MVSMSGCRPHFRTACCAWPWASWRVALDEPLFCEKRSSAISWPLSHPCTALWAHEWLTLRAAEWITLRTRGGKKHVETHGTTHRPGSAEWLARWAAAWTSLWMALRSPARRSSGLDNHVRSDRRVAWWDRIWTD